jgi:DNA-binding transcriptional ArsR family regulator
MKPAATVAALAALAHEHRLAAFRLLVQAGPDGLAAGIVAERVGILPSSLTFHLQQLRHAGLIGQRRAGRQIIYVADFAAMNDLLQYLTLNCCGDGDAGICAAPVCRPRGAKARSSAGRSRRRPA